MPLDLTRIWVTTVTWLPTRQAIRHEGCAHARYSVFLQPETRPTVYILWSPQAPELQCTSITLRPQDIPLHEHCDSPPLTISTMSHIKVRLTLWESLGLVVLSAVLIKSASTFLAGLLCRTDFRAKKLWRMVVKCSSQHVTWYSEAYLPKDSYHRAWLVALYP